MLYKEKALVVATAPVPPIANTAGSGHSPRKGMLCAAVDTGTSKNRRRICL
ncbi:MAG: hypothetical protein GX663_11555 [Clostridiales bacterium]|nr:hypothetical protein [Clostridiales bacterium]